MTDLFSRLEPPCGDCHQLGEKPIDSGLRYCWGELTWRWATDRVEGCRYRDRPRYRAPFPLTSEPGDRIVGDKPTRAAQVEGTDHDQ